MKIGPSEFKWFHGILCKQRTSLANIMISYLIAPYSRTAWLMNQSECPPLDSLTSFLARSLMRTLSVNGSLDSMQDSASLNLERYSIEFRIDKNDIQYGTV